MKKSVENLEGSEMLIVSVKRINGDKFQLCFAQKVRNPYTRPNSIAGLLNESDDRFTSGASKPRYSWMSGTAADLKSKLDIDVSDLGEVGAEKELNILNPTIEGDALNIQITETTKGSEYDLDNIDSSAKRAGKDGDFILTADGEFIFVKAVVVPGPAKHVFIKDTERASSGASAGSAVADALDSE